MAGNKVLSDRTALYGLRLQGDESSKVNNNGTLTLQGRKHLTFYLTFDDCVIAEIRQACAFKRKLHIYMYPSCDFTIKGRSQGVLYTKHSACDQFLQSLVPHLHCKIT